MQEVTELTHCIRLTCFPLFIYFFLLSLCTSILGQFTSAGAGPAHPPDNLLASAAGMQSTRHIYTSNICHIAQRLREYSYRELTNKNVIKV